MNYGNIIHVYMGSARNLKLGDKGGQGPGHRGAIIFLAFGPNVNHIQLLCASKTRIGGPGADSWSRDQRAKAP